MFTNLIFIRNFTPPKYVFIHQTQDITLISQKIKEIPP